MAEHIFDSLVDREFIDIIITQKLDLIRHVSFAFFQIVLGSLLYFRFVLCQHIIQIISYDLVYDSHIHTQQPIKFLRYRIDIFRGIFTSLIDLEVTVSTD
jgi:hypothetical protein